jgi:uncharacterized protein
MKNSKYRELIIKKASRYYREYDGVETSHDFNHFLRVERIAKRIAEEELADIEIVEAECLLFDVARMMEDRGEIEDHAKEGAAIARNILFEIGFPSEKIDKVCYAISVHRRSAGINPESIEAKILQDADYLDAMGAIDIVRVISSSIQTKKYKKPIYINTPFSKDSYDNSSAIHFIMSQVKHPKIQPENFHTKLAQKLAIGRFKLMKEFVERFLAEWEGKD